MADEYAQNLPDIPERTATADTDLVHVNSGGSDYKQTKKNFTADLATNVSFNNTSTLESQIEALGNTFHVYTGYIESYGHQTATGVPQNTNFFVTVYVKDASHKRVVIRRAISGNEAYTKYYGGSSVGWSEWVQEPSRSEITSLNNSLANIRTNGQFLGYKDKYTTNISISFDNSYAKIGDVYDDFGVPSGAYIISFFIRGWSGASGTLMLMAGSDGKTIYVVSNKAGTIGSITVRVWYAILN